MPHFNSENPGSLIESGESAEFPISPEPPYEEIHRKAVEACQETYRDPETGYTVFTEYFLKNQGFCCRTGCRHCPYGFKRSATMY